MIEVEKLTKSYRTVTAVGGVTFTARSGHVTGFPGPVAFPRPGRGHAGRPRAATRQMKDHCRKDA